MGNGKIYWLWLSRPCTTQMNTLGLALTGYISIWPIHMKYLHRIAFGTYLSSLLKKLLSNIFVFFPFFIISTHIEKDFCFKSTTTQIGIRILGIQIPFLKKILPNGLKKYPVALDKIMQYFPTKVCVNFLFRGDFWGVIT